MSNPNMVAGPIPQMAEIQDTLRDYVPNLYSNGAHHMYEYDMNGKLRHISRAQARQEIEQTIADAYGMDVDAATTALIADYGYAPRPAQPNALATVTPIGHARPNRPLVAAGRQPQANAFPHPQATPNKVIAPVYNIPTFKERIFGKLENLANRRKVAAFAVGALAVLGIASAVSKSDSAEASPRFKTEQSSSSTTQKTTSTTEAPTTTTTEAPTTTTTAPEQQSEMGRVAAIANRLHDLGLEQGQYTEITDEHAQLPGAIEANWFSMNHGPKAWDHYERTMTGAKQMGQDILNGRGTFSASDANVAHQSLNWGGASDEFVGKLMAGDYNDMSIRTFVVDSPVYHDMTFNNNGQLANEQLRTGVGNQDVFSIVSYFNKATGQYETINVRIDCGGIAAQVFKSMEVPAAPKPVEKPVKKPVEKPVQKPVTTTTTAKPPVTTTTRPIVTTTTRPRVTTTTRPHRTTTTTTPSTTSTTTYVTITTPTTAKSVVSPPTHEVTTTVVLDPETPANPTTSTVRQNPTSSTAAPVTTQTTTTPEGPVTSPSLNYDGLGSLKHGEGGMAGPIEIALALSALGLVAKRRQYITVVRKNQDGSINNVELL